MMKPETTLRTALSATPAPEGLYETVLARVAAARIRAARIRASIFAIVAAVSFTALVPVVAYTLDQLYRSGFYEYASLLVSDRSVVSTYWQEFVLSLIESLPSVALLLLLPIAVALLWSLSRLIKNIRTAVRYA